MARFHVIIPAAGSGSRMAMDAPKQYLKLKGKPLIHHVIQVFAQSTKVDTIHVVLNPDDTVWSAADNQLSQKMQIHYCGGATRAASVLNTLHAIETQIAADDWILVHDAARPGLSNALLNKLINALQDDAVGGMAMYWPTARNRTLPSNPATTAAVETYSSTRRTRRAAARRRPRNHRPSCARGA